MEKQRRMPLWLQCQDCLLRQYAPIICQYLRNGNLFWNPFHFYGELCSALHALVVKKEGRLPLTSSEQSVDRSGTGNHPPGVFIGRRCTEQRYVEMLASVRQTRGDQPSFFLSLNSPSITMSSVLLGGFRPANLNTDDTIRSTIARLNQGYVRRKAVAKPVNTALTYSPRARKCNMHSASKLTMSGRRTGLGNRPTSRSLPFLIKGNLAKRPPRSSPAMTRPVPR